MIQTAPGARIYLGCRPVDMRRGFDGLAADVAKVLQADLWSGAVFVFRGNRGNNKGFQRGAAEIKAGQRVRRQTKKAQP